MRFGYRLACLATALWYAVSALSAEASDAWAGKALRIVDGDSLQIGNADGVEYRIRLYGIDCPEKGQQWEPKRLRRHSALQKASYWKFKNYGEIETDEWLPWSRCLTKLLCRNYCFSMGWPGLMSGTASAQNANHCGCYKAPPVFPGEAFGNTLTLSRLGAGVGVNDKEIRMITGKKRPFFVVAVAALIAVIPATGNCAEPPKETQTVEWFMKPENKEILNETLRLCRNNPGELKDTPNCINAEEAKRRRWGQRAGVPKF